MNPASPLWHFIEVLSDCSAAFLLVGFASSINIHEALACLLEPIQFYNTCAYLIDFFN